MRAVITHDLYDPDSAKFRDVQRVTWIEGLSMPGNEVYCGEINAKNLYGAYVGFHHFVAFPPKPGAPESIAHGHVMLALPGDPNFGDREWNVVCKGKKGKRMWLWPWAMQSPLEAHF